MNQRVQNWLQWACIALIAYIPFHALISTWAYSNFGGELIFKAAKDGFVALIGLICLGLAIKYRPKISGLEKILAILIYLFVSLHIILLTPGHDEGQYLAGVIVNTRYIIFFAAVFYLSRISGKSVFRKRLVKTAYLSFLAVILFGFFQATILPKDFLRHFGYGPETIPAFSTIDNDQSTARIQSTLRGPNPLGAYIVAMTPLAVLLLVAKRKNVRDRVLIFITALMTGIVLFKTYARAASLGIAAVLGSLAFLKKWFFDKRVMYGLTAIVALVCFTFIIFRNTPIVQKVIFHSDPLESSQQDSDDNRLASLRQGIRSVADEPLGHGVGAAGIASYYGDSPRIIENFYLDLAYQIGIDGLLIIILLHAAVALLLLVKIKDPLSLALLVGFAGLFVVNNLWPAWSDETLAYTWWGLAGAVLGSATLGKVAKKATVVSSEKAKA